MMKMACKSAAALLVMMFLVSCSTEIKTEPLTRTSKKLLCEGMTEAEVRSRFGVPEKILLTDFIAPTDGVPKLPPGVDKQFFYYTQNGKHHTFFYFKKGEVKLA